MPAAYYKGVGKDAYVEALNSEKGIFNPTGLMPADGPKTCLAVLGEFNPKVQGKTHRPGQDLHQRVRQGRHLRQLTRHYRQGTCRARSNARHTPARASRGKVVRSRTRRPT